MNKIFITGPPGVGKTTVIMRLLEELRKSNVKVGGFYCPEVRMGNKRIGFKIIDIMTGEEAWLAKEEEGFPRVGKYHVLINEVENLSSKILISIQNSDLIIIDEIGPMELKINSLRHIIDFSINSNKPLIAVLHRNLVSEFKNYKIIYMNYENRNQVFSILINEIKSIIMNKK